MLRGPYDSSRRQVLRILELDMYSKLEDEKLRQWFRKPVVDPFLSTELRYSLKKLDRANHYTSRLSRVLSDTLPIAAYAQQTSYC